jgi:phosphatidylinositol alpha-mannosyltransferase
MAAGAGAVMGGDNPGYRYVLDNDEAVLFNPKDVSELALKLDVLLSQKKSLEAVHERQQKLVKKYDINSVGRQVEAAYYSAIAKK